MATSCTTANLGATLNNLNMSGTISYNATEATAIPPGTVGLYQLMNQLISEVSSLKATIKTNEKALIAALKADAADAAVTLAGNTTTRSAINEGVTNDTRGGLTSTPADKPAIITSATAKHNLSEDAVFDIFSGITHLIMKLNNDGDVNGAAIAANCGTSTS
tara:strand:- start:2787 stop:3272 length:486 start_codon:yes stop_codon:yes gene_type:complete